MSSPNLNFRPMEPADLTAVATLEARAKDEPWSLALFAGEFDLSPQARHWLVVEPVEPGSCSEVGSNSEVGGASKERTVIGFAGVMLVADEAHVLNVVVDPDYQRRGIGQKLLARLLLDSVDRGAVSATLEVRSDNEAALSLYRRLGFESAGTRSAYYADGGDAVIMWVHRLHRSDRSTRLAGMVGAAPPGDDD